MAQKAAKNTGRSKKWALLTLDSLKIQQSGFKHQKKNNNIKFVIKIQKKTSITTYNEFSILKITETCFF